ncbi:MAG: alginate export family protein [Candidatus Omnitrophota bacterium]
MKLLKVFCVLALVFVVSTIAYAETQSVKVSGDITLRSLTRGDFDLDRDDAALVNTGSQSTDWATHLMSTAEVQIDADLTDNVSGVIRLVNQRVWGDGLQQSETDETGLVGIPFGDQFTANPVAPGQANNFEIGVDLAYIELKEFLYSPLTLKIGRQDLWFGKGFIVGANLQDPQGALFAPEYTAITSFDAIRGTLDYDPWTIDAVFAKIGENFRRADDDVNLWGVNVGYVFDEYNGEAEAYWWYKQQRYCGAAGAGSTTLISVTNNRDDNDVHVLGLRGSLDPLEDWTVALEGAYQLGQYLGAINQINTRERSAWAIDAIVECRYFQDDYAWKPVLGAEYIFYSGQADMANVNAGSTGDYNGWDKMYRGKFDTAIREFQNVYYGTAMASCPSFTNQHQILVRGSVEPTDSLTVAATYAHFWLAEDWAVNTNTNKDIGSEVDVTLTWDYTEDVTFGLLTGFFFPGSHFQGTQDDVATDVVGTVKLSF